MSQVLVTFDKWGRTPNYQGCLPGLGEFADDRERLRLAIDYLARWERD